MSKKKIHHPPEMEQARLEFCEECIRTIKGRKSFKQLKDLFRQQTNRDLLWYHQAGKFVDLLHPQGGDRRYGLSRMQAIAEALDQPDVNVKSLATLLRYYRQFFNAYNHPEVIKLCIDDDGFTLSWTHVLKLSSVEKPYRDSLQEQCIKNKWPTGKLQEVIEAKHGKQSQGGRPLAAPKSRVDNLQQMTRMSEDWLRRFDEAWFGGKNSLHEGELEQHEL